jgi:flagella basal body P-ring formation protein FlgA
VKQVQGIHGFLGVLGQALLWLWVAATGLGAAAGAAAGATARTTAPVESPLVGSAEQLEAALGKIVQAHFGNRSTDWSFVREHPFQTVQPESLRLLPPHELKGGRNWFQLRAEGSSPQAYLLPVDIAWRDSLWVSQRSLPAGHPIEPGDLVRRWQQHTLSPQEIAFQSSPVGLCLRHGVKQGDILSRAMLREPYLIERGATVNMIYQSGALSVATRAEALENGSLGERIRVRPLDGKRVCQAVISGDQEVEVTLP